MHGTSAYLGRTILAGPTPTLSPTSCPVFKEPLLYVFHGRPAYRVADEQEDRNDGFYSPVCFILAPDALLSIKRIFPFDTGAYDRYKPYLHHRMTRDEFALATTSDTPQRHVTAFFNTNGNYYLGTVTPKLPIPASEMEVQAYYNLITAPGFHDFDGRCSSVELQVDHDISLSDKTLAVILPNALANVPELREAVVKRLKAKLITYPEFAHSRPSDYHGHVRMLAGRFLSGAGLL
jgi:hypothetical protein